MLFIWMIVNTVYLLKKMKNMIKEKNKDIKLIVRCEKCNNEHNATIDEFFSTHMLKTKSKTISANVGTLGVSRTYYNYLAKKFYCPICNKKTWSELKNYNELAIKNTKLIVPLILKYFAKLIIGGGVIFLVSKLFI